MSSTRERLIVFSVGVIVGAGVGVAAGRALYYGVGYDIFKDQDLAEEDVIDFSPPDDSALAGGEPLLDPPAAASDSAAMDDGVTELSMSGDLADVSADVAHVEPIPLSDDELDKLKRLVLPQLKDADIEEWKRLRTARAASDAAAPGG